MGVAFFTDLCSYLPCIEKEGWQERKTSQVCWASSTAIVRRASQIISGDSLTCCVPSDCPPAPGRTGDIGDTWPPRPHAASVHSFRKSITSLAEASENFGSHLPPRESLGTPVRVDPSGPQCPRGYSADRIIHEILTTEFLLAVWQTVPRANRSGTTDDQRRSLAKHSAFRVAVNVTILD